MGKWRTCTIGDLGTVVGGATPSTKRVENYDGGTIAWITPKDLAGFSGRFIFCGERCITEQGLKSCSTQLVPAHTVLFSSRAPIGYIAIAGQDVCTNQGFKSVVPNESTDEPFPKKRTQKVKKKWNDSRGIRYRWLCSGAEKIILKTRGRNPTQSRVRAEGVVEDFQIGKDIALRRRSGWIVF